MADETAGSVATGSAAVAAAAIVPSTPDEQGESKWLLVERLTKAGTVLFALIYGAGFLVISIHHGQYGVIMVEFLRARILAAGLLFAVLTVAPIVAISRVSGLFGLKMPVGTLRVKEEHVGYAELCSFGLFPLVAYGMAQVVERMFTRTPTPPASLWWFVLGLRLRSSQSQGCEYG